MKRFEWARMGIVGLCCAALASAFAGCGAEANEGAALASATAESELSSGCRDPDIDPSKTFTGGVDPKYASPQTYSDCEKAQVIEVRKYASNYAVGGHTVVSWADSLPSGAEECRNIYLTAEVYVKNGSSWSLVKSKKAHGDFLLDDEASDVVPPPSQPARPRSGDGPSPLQPLSPEDLIPPGPKTPAFCNGPRVYFWGSEMEAGKTYRIAASARKTSSSSTLRKFSVLSVAGTCGQDDLRCCTSGVECDASLSCQDKYCAPCGGNGQACCAGSACDDAGLECDGSGICRTCGGNGEACCAGNSCDSGDYTCQSGSCKACGGSDQACCAGSSCDSGDYTCQGGKCKACGGTNQTCCAGSRCDNGNLLCDSGNTCRSCGASGQPCCNGSCNGSLTCDGNTCKEPLPSCPPGGCPVPLVCRAATGGGMRCLEATGPCNAPGELCCPPELVGQNPFCRSDYFNVTCNPTTEKCQ